MPAKVCRFRCYHSNPLCGFLCGFSYLLISNQLAFLKALHFPDKIIPLLGCTLLSMELLIQTFTGGNNGRSATPHDAGNAIIGYLYLQQQANF